MFSWIHLVANSFHEDFEIILGRLFQAQVNSASVGFHWRIITGNNNNRLFVKMDGSYADYFPEYSTYFGRALILLKSMYGMTNSVNVFANELIDWLINESVSKQYQCQISIYYKYEPYGTKIVVLYYVGYCVH